MGHPGLYSLLEAAEFLGVSEMVVKDFIDCGDLATVGSRKEHIRLVDLNKFLGEEPASLQNQERPVDFSGKQRSNVPCSILIEDISEEEWETMKREEHKPYFDEQKQRWCIALSLGKDENGRRKRKIISGKSQMEVWESYKEYIQQHSREVALVCSDTPIVREGIAAGLRIASYEPEQDVTVRECFPEFLRTVRRRVKDRTYGDYLNASKYILEHLGDKRMYEINRSVLEKFFDELAQDKYAKGKETEPTHYYGQSKINKVYDLVRRFTKYYSDAGRGSQLLKMDFAANIEKPKTKAGHKERTTAYTKEDIQKILQAVKSDKMVYCWVSILLATGCRPSEALALQWGDIDFTGKTVSITKALGKSADFKDGELKRSSAYRAVIKELKNERPGQAIGYQHRKLPLEDNILEAIRVWRFQAEHDAVYMDKKRRNGTEEMIFTGRNGNLRIFDDYAQRYKRLLKKAGLDPSKNNLYRFRHTMCIDLFRRGVDAKTIQMVMGDNSMNVVMDKYANLQQEDVLSKADCLSGRTREILEAGKQEANSPLVEQV